MKPLGPIPAGFAAIDGELAIGGRKVSNLVAEAGSTPLFVYSADRIAARVADLRRALPDQVDLHYAVKANPYGPVLGVMAGLVDGFDIALPYSFDKCSSFTFLNYMFLLLPGFFSLFYK